MRLLFSESHPFSGRAHRAIRASKLIMNAPSSVIALQTFIILRNGGVQWWSRGITDASAQTKRQSSEGLQQNWYRTWPIDPIWVSCRATD
jgi:hypothetical protein